MKRKRVTHLFGGHSDQRGQVEVETAIVLPAVVFLLLGLLQLGMIHQARLFAEYAAYKAVRTGALKNADPDAMRLAARAAALPILAYGTGDDQRMDRTDSETAWITKLGTIEGANMIGGITGSDDPFARDKVPGEFVALTICGPTQDEVQAAKYTVEGDDFISFDSVALSGVMPGPKLRIEIVLNYHMVIPFADAVIYRMWKGKSLTETLRLDSRSKLQKTLGDATALTNFDAYDAAAAMRIFILPIRAQYAMRLQSDVKVEALPTSNACEGSPSGG